MGFKRRWTLENIKGGFDLFFQQHGRFPSVQEIDKLENLPSCRQIQRVFGGLPKLRELLGHKEIFLSKGKHRSKIGFDSNQRSRISEARLRDILYEKFHDPFVHLEKPIDTERKLRTDFYVFNPIENFSVDIFTTETSHDLASNVYSKVQKYSHLNLKEKMYLVLFSEKLTEENVALLIKRKKNKFPENIELITLNNFIKKISSMPAYPNPIGSSRG